MIEIRRLYDRLIFMKKFIYLERLSFYSDRALLYPQQEITKQVVKEFIWVVAPMQVTLITGCRSRYVLDR